jgi:hypothetical protein
MISNHPCGLGPNFGLCSERSVYALVTLFIKVFNSLTPTADLRVFCFAEHPRASRARAEHVPWIGRITSLRRTRNDVPLTARQVPSAVLGAISFGVI